MPLLDPPAPPEGGTSMRAKDLLNKVCVFQPVTLGEWPATDEKKAQPYVECNVWVLDRAGVLEQGTNVRVSWWKAYDQLHQHIHEYVGGKPVTEEGSNAVVLLNLVGEAREVAARVVDELTGGGTKPLGDGDEF